MPLGAWYHAPSAFAHIYLSTHLGDHTPAQMRAAAVATSDKLLVWLLEGCRASRAGEGPPGKTSGCCQLLPFQVSLHNRYN
mgnify:CR=1 FL=1